MGDWTSKPLMHREAAASNMDPDYAAADILDPARLTVVVLVLELTSAALFLANQAERRAQYNQKRGRLTRADLSPVPGSDTPWVYLWNNRSNGWCPTMCAT